MVARLRQIRRADNLAGWLRREHEVYGALAGSFLAELVGWDDDGVRPVLVLEDLSGADWTPRWDGRRIGAVRAALAELAARPAPPNTAAVDESLADLFGRWQIVAEEPRPFLSTGLRDARWLERALPTILEAVEPRPSPAARSATSTSAATTCAFATNERCSSTGTGRRTQTPTSMSRPGSPAFAVEGGPDAVGDPARQRRARRLRGRRLGRGRRPPGAGHRSLGSRGPAGPARGRARLDRPRIGSSARLAKPVGERLELAGVQPDLAGLDRGLHLARELSASEVWSGSSTVVRLATTDEPSRSWMSTVVSCRLSSMYGSSGTPTQTVTEPPSGSDACSTTGDDAKRHARTVTTSDGAVMLNA